MRTDLKYVVTAEHPMVSTIGLPNLALTCFDSKRRIHGGVGFESTLQGIFARELLVSKGLTYDGSNFRSAHQNFSTHFVSQPDNLNSSATFVSKGIQQNEGLNLTGLRDLVEREYHSLYPQNRNLSGIVPLVEAHLKVGLTLQIWPWRTPYGSFSIIFGPSRRELKRWFEKVLMLEKGSIEDIKGTHFPIF